MSARTRTRGWLWLPLVFLALSCGCGDRSSGSSGSVAGEIVFSSNRLGDPQLFSMNADGSDPRPVFLDLYQNDEPSWSPDRSRVAYVKTLGFGLGQVKELWIADSDGKNRVQLQGAQASEINENPDWSSTGNRIVYSSNAEAVPFARGTARDLYRIDLDGSGEPTRLTTGDNFVRVSPTGSKLGSRIAFSGCDCGGPATPIACGSCTFQTAVWSIYVMDSDGGNIAPISEAEAGDWQDIQPDWSVAVDDGPIVFSSNRNGDSFEIFVMDHDGGNVVQLTGPLAYVADGDSGLRVIGVSNPAAPWEVGTLDTPGFAQNVSVSQGLAYVADGEAGLQVIDVSSPYAPVELGALETLGSAQAAEVDQRGLDKWSYVAGGSAGLRVVDVSDPALPVEEGALDTPGLALGLDFLALNPSEIAPRYAYVADGEEGLRVIDVTEPALPVELGALDTPGSAVGVDAVELRVNFVTGLISNNGVIRRFAYVADGGSGLRVIDVTDATSPEERSFFDTPGFAQDVKVLPQVDLAGKVVGAHAYVADGEAGLQVIDVTDPALPVQVGSVDTPGIAQGVDVAGTLVYVADGEAGLQVIDVTDPADPMILFFADTPGDARGVEIGAGGADSFAPTWSPDGSQILFTSSGPGGALQIFIMDADGRNRRPLTSTLNGTDSVGASW